MSKHSGYLLATIPIMLMLGCGSSETPSQTGVGGKTGSGSTETGGVASSGGSGTRAGTGGATGGNQGSGGAGVTGGANSGGSKSTGGEPATGGAAATGGSKASTGGTRATGGSKATGGSSSQTSAAGGNEPVGGSRASGGSVALGGSQSLGGTQATGGSKAAGGSSAIGGSNATGGSTSNGGQSSATCPSGAKPTDGTKKITVGGLSREYILHVPSAYTGSAPVPLVLDFHPIGGADSSWRTGSPYPAVIDKEGVISAFPNGEPGPMGNAWNVQGCCVSKINGADVDDVAFAKAIVEDIEKIACIDPKRVYAVGFSMGGGMSNYLACHAADTFAAVGPAAFDLTQQNEPGCTPSRPITVVEWRGKNDTVVPYAGGHSALVSGMAIDFLGAVGTFQKWAELDGCTGSAGAADSNNCQTYSQCSAGVQVTLCTANSGGHEAANASVVWPMLKKYTMP